MIAFFIGAVLGCAGGVLVMCLMCMAHDPLDADDCDCDCKKEVRP